MSIFVHLRLFEEGANGIPGRSLERGGSKRHSRQELGTRREQMTFQAGAWNEVGDGTAFQAGAWNEAYVGI